MMTHPTPTAEDWVRAADGLGYELAEARDFVIEHTFGGPNVYRLLKERNPQIDLILNAGIVAGLRQETAWRLGGGQ